MSKSEVTHMIIPERSEDLPVETVDLCLCFSFPVINNNPQDYGGETHYHFDQTSEMVMC